MLIVLIKQVSKLASIGAWTKNLVDARSTTDHPHHHTHYRLHPTILSSHQLSHNLSCLCGLLVKTSSLHLTCCRHHEFQFTSFRFHTIGRNATANRLDRQWKNIQEGLISITHQRTWAYAESLINGVNLPERNNTSILHKQSIAPQKPYSNTISNVNMYENNIQLKLYLYQSSVKLWGAGRCPSFTTWKSHTMQTTKKVCMSFRLILSFVLCTQSI